MEWAIEQLVNVGQLAMPVVGLAVIIILLVSIADRHPRDDKPPEDPKPPIEPDV